MSDSIEVYSTDTGYSNNINQLKKEKTKAWSIYDSWRSKPVKCPALNKNVNFSMKGWKHITGLTGHKRKGNDVYRRLKLLPYARKLIKRSHTIQLKKEKGGVIFISLEAMIDVKYYNRSEFRKIRVIIIEDKKGNYIFYSVMDKGVF